MWAPRSVAGSNQPIGWLNQVARPLVALAGRLVVRSTNATGASPNLSIRAVIGEARTTGVFVNQARSASMCASCCR